MRGKLIAFVIGVLVAALPLLYQGWQMQQSFSEAQTSLETQVETLQGRVSDLEQQLRISRLRNQLGTLIFEVQNQNFGRARELSTSFFNDVADAATGVEDTQLRSQLEEILQRRDELTADLTALSPDSAKKLQGIYTSLP